MADENVNSQAPQTQEPQDIAQAFQMVRENNKAAAQPAGQEEQGVQAEEGSQGQPEAGATAEPVAVSGGGDLPDEPQAAPEPPIGGGTGSLGGPAARGQQDDYVALQNNLIVALQQEAQQSVIEKFRENEIKMMDIGDIYERREDGTVIFHNPDDPNHPFDSREKAQAWINSMNQQIQTAYQQEVYKEQQNLYNQAMPSIELLQFAPVYDSMSKEVQDIFDLLIDPYSITDKTTGDVIGFNCSLPDMARQAVKIAEQFGGQQQEPQQAQQQAQAQQGKTPAMDLKAGSGASADEKEPTNLAEAMALLNKQNKERRNGN